MAFACATERESEHVAEIRDHHRSRHGGPGGGRADGTEHRADIVIAAADGHATLFDMLEVRYPGMRAQIEVIDVATPITYERYAGNWRGASAGWALTTRKMSMMIGQGMLKTLPGLDGFFMIGQWVEPGGQHRAFCRFGTRCTTRYLQAG